VNKIAIFSLITIIVITAGCSKQNESTQTEQQAKQPAQADTAKPALPPGHPPMTQQPSTQQGQSAMQQPSSQGAGQGKVLNVTHAAGYTYMEIDTGDGKSTWIAANAMRVKEGDTVQWQDAMLMQNFTSKSLHKTFDKILFVSYATVVE
jgi:hypothetical protein